jgi:hypothetical protein
MPHTISFSEEIDKINDAFPVVLHCAKCDRLRSMKIDRSSDKLAQRCTACGTARCAVRAVEIKKMNAIPERTEPTLWKAEQSEIARLKGELATCEKEKRSLNDLVRHIGETVIATSRARHSRMLNRPKAVTGTCARQKLLSKHARCHWEISEAMRCAQGGWPIAHCRRNESMALNKVGHHQ